MSATHHRLEICFALAAVTVLVAAYALAQGPSDTDTLRAMAELDAANAQADAAFERMDRAAAVLCQAEHGPGSTHVWTADNQLVCYPATVPSYPLQGGVKLASSI